MFLKFKQYFLKNLKNILFDKNNNNNIKIKKLAFNKNLILKNRNLFLNFKKIKKLKIKIKQKNTFLTHFQKKRFKFKHFSYYFNNHKVTFKNRKIARKKKRLIFNTANYFYHVLNQKITPKQIKNYYFNQINSLKLNKNLFLNLKNYTQKKINLKYLNFQKNFKFLNFFKKKDFFKNFLIKKNLNFLYFLNLSFNFALIDFVEFNFLKFYYYFVLKNFYKTKFFYYLIQYFLKKKTIQKNLTLKKFLQELKLDSILFFKFKNNLLKLNYLFNLKLKKKLKINQKKSLFNFFINFKLHSFKKVNKKITVTKTKPSILMNKYKMKDTFFFFTKINKNYSTILVKPIKNYLNLKILKLNKNFSFLYYQKLLN